MNLSRLKGALARRRPFPLRPAALMHCRVSYSQFGEDLFLASLFSDLKVKGYYVDVGCYRPVSFSNTYRFYQLGWHGIAIDASPRWQAEWSRIRPRDVFINRAIADTAKQMYYCFDRVYPTCSCLVVDDPASVVPNFTEERYEVSRLMALPLTEILAAQQAPKRFELLNVDCEGLDLEVIRTVDFDAFRPQTIAIEDHHTSCDSETVAFLTAKEYRLAAMIGYTKIFSDNGN